MQTERYKRYTILHSNDMHGDFLAEVRGQEGDLIGGLALLSGYLKRVRQEEKNVLYVIAGDMLQGSMIDAEYRGISTIEMMNYLAPDVATLGNHEFEYGLPHLLFLEKLANFPIVNANLYIDKYHRRLMQPYHVTHLDGLDILFIGIITDEVLKALKRETDVASFICLEDAAAEVGRICGAYKDEDIDLTVLLTHIGFEADRELAARLRPEWGVDLIIGGHSHTILDQPAEVNGVLIAQAGVGTHHLGRFDLLVDDDTNRVAEWQWRLIPVDGSLAEPDAELQRFIDSFQVEVDRKYKTPIGRLARTLTHPAQAQETELGNLFADIIQQRAGTDLALFASFAFRGTEMGPVITLGEFLERLPYDDALLRFTLRGADLLHIVRYLLRPENQAGAGYFFQVSRGVRAEYDRAAGHLVSLAIGGRPVDPEQSYSLCIQSYHHDDNPEKHYGLPRDRFGPSQVVATSMRDLFEEYLRQHQNVDSRVEGRLVLR